MADDDKARNGDEKFRYRGRIPRRRMLGWSAGALGATVLAPRPWRAAFGQAKPYKIGTLQPLSGAAAAGGKPPSSALRWQWTVSTSPAASMAGPSS